MQTRSRAVFNLFVLFALLVSLLGIAITYTPARAAGILFVKPNGNGNCASWLSACDLQFALYRSLSTDQIWVQAGTHTPDYADRSASFTLRIGVSIYGGFAGTETQLSQRNPAVNITVLSGDLNGDDVGFTNNDENSYHVVVSGGVDSSTILDGFIIHGGNANNYEFDQAAGAGVYSNGGSPTLRNIIFSENSALGYGGGMYNKDGNATLINVTFTGNSAGDGGGMYNEGGSPTLTNITFTGNFGGEGGGMYNNSGSPALTNVTFSSNSASNAGGGMSNHYGNPTLTNMNFSDNSAGEGGGGMKNFSGSPTLTNGIFSNNFTDTWGGSMYNMYNSDATLINVTISANFAAYGGGGISNYESSSPTLMNVTFSGNSAGEGGGMHNDYSSSPRLINTIIANSANGGDCVNFLSILDPSSANNIIEDAANACGLTNGADGNIVGSDPKLGPLANNGGRTQTHAPLTGSPAINAGRNTNCPATDQRGVARPWGSHCDIGSYEFATIAIRGNAGTKGVILSYTDGTPKTAASQPNGTYSLTVPSGWLGTVTPSHPCFTFSPAQRSFNVILANQTAQNFSALFNPASGCTAVTVRIKGVVQGTYGLPANSGDRLSYSVDSGPMFVNSPNGKPFVASERMIFPKGSNNPTHFSELMGLPAHLKSTRYSFPAYDNLFFNSQLRFANVGTANTTVIVIVGSVEKGRYNLAPNQSMKVSYPNLSGGPVVIQSTGNVPIIASLRVVPLTFNGSFSEMMGLPQSQVGTSYVFPWYNNATLDTQLRIGNIGTSTTTVTVTIGGVPRGNFTLAPNASQRVSFAGVNSGPVRVTRSGNVPIVASMRVAFRSGNTWTGFSELLGLPQSQLHSTYHFPWYNNVALDTQLRVANMSSSTATVHVYIGGQEPTGSPFTLAAGASTRKSFAANNGPVKVVSNQNIVASLRVLFPKGSSTPTSFSELMGLPQSQLTTGYLFPWYNNIGLDTQLRIGVP